MNKLYQRIEQNPRSQGRVKLIGIGAGNSDFEVNYFRKVYAIPFPLFPDSDFRVHQLLGEVRTPYFFGISLSDDGPPRVVYSKLGGFDNPDRFLSQMLDLAGL